MFRVWLLDRALLRCAVTFDRFGASFKVRVRVVSGEIKLWSDDAFSELVLRMSPDLHFEYADPRDFPEEAKVFSRGLVVLFPSRESISFLELIETD